MICKYYIPLEAPNCVSTDRTVQQCTLSSINMDGNTQRVSTAKVPTLSVSRERVHFVGPYFHDASMPNLYPKLPNPKTTPNHMPNSIIFQ